MKFPDICDNFHMICKSVIFITDEAAGTVNTSVVCCLHSFQLEVSENKKAVFFTGLLNSFHVTLGGLWTLA